MSGATRALHDGFDFSFVFTGCTTVGHHNALLRDRSVNRGVHDETKD